MTSQPSGVVGNKPMQGDPGPPQEPLACHLKSGGFVATKHYRRKVLGRGYSMSGGTCGSTELNAAQPPQAVE